MIKLFNKKVCLTSPISIMIIVALLFSTIVIASAVKNGEDIKKVIPNEEKLWVPTAEDIAYQDSMYTIISNTQNDITDIKQDIVYILERLDYSNGSWDSVRYVKGGKIDKLRNQ